VRVRIVVTAEDIAAAGFRSSHPDDKDPVELAIARLTGESVMCDQDGPDQEIATIGQGGTTLVVELPREQAAWIDRYYRGETVEPFEFEIEIEEWLTRFLELVPA
jgi:hypothetical protein